jgi:hypothetical protein
MKPVCYYTEDAHYNSAYSPCDNSTVWRVVLRTASTLDPLRFWVFCGLHVDKEIRTWDRSGSVVVIDFYQLHL